MVAKGFGKLVSVLFLLLFFFPVLDGPGKRGVQSLRREGEANQGQAMVLWSAMSTPILLFWFASVFVF